MFLVSTRETNKYENTRNCVQKIKGNKIPNKSVEEKIIKERFLADSGKVKLNLSSPFSTISSHLIFLSDSLYDPKMAAKTISFAPEDTAEAPELAIKLKQIFHSL